MPQLLLLQVRAQWHCVWSCRGIPESMCAFLPSLASLSPRVFVPTSSCCHGQALLHLQKCGNFQAYLTSSAPGTAVSSPCARACAPPGSCSPSESWVGPALLRPLPRPLHTPPVPGRHSYARSVQALLWRCSPTLCEATSPTLGSPGRWRDLQLHSSQALLS